MSAAPARAPEWAAGLDLNTLKRHWAIERLFPLEKDVETRHETLVTDAHAIATHEAFHLRRLLTAECAVNR